MGQLCVTLSPKRINLKEESYFVADSRIQPVGRWFHCFQACGEGGGRSVNRGGSCSHCDGCKDVHRQDTVLKGTSPRTIQPGLTSSYIMSPSLWDYRFSVDYFFDEI